MSDFLMSDMAIRKCLFLGWRYDSATGNPRNQQITESQNTVADCGIALFWDWIGWYGKRNPEIKKSLNPKIPLPLKPNYFVPAIAIGFVL